MMVRLKCGHSGHTPVPLCSPSPERAIGLVSVGSTGSPGKRDAPAPLSAPGARVSDENRLGTMGPRAEVGSYKVPAEKGCSFVLGSPASRTPPVVHGGPARPQLTRGSSWLWVLVEEVTVFGTGCDDARPANPQGWWLWGVASRPEKTSFKGEAGWQRKSAGLGGSADKTRPSTHVHTPTSTHKHTPMHGLIHVCTRPEAHAHTSTSASFDQTLQDDFRERGPHPRKGRVLCHGAPRTSHPRCWD